MHPLLIVNREAGALHGGRSAVTPEVLRDAFAAAGTPVTLEIAPPATLEAAVRAAVARPPASLFVGGGDGTINTAARALVDTRIPLGVVPLGTLNHFARDIGLPGTWREAIPVLAGGATRDVDVGEINGRVFINNCSIGSYPEAVRQRDKLRREHGRGKWAAMAVASFAVFRRLRRFRVRIETQDTTLTLRTPFVFIGNNRYSGHLLDQSLRPRLDEAQLSIFTTRASRHFTILRLAWQSLVHSIDAADALETRTTREAVVSSPTGQPLPLAVDGELVNLAPPFRVRIRPGALRVIAPRVTTPESDPTPNLIARIARPSA